MQLETIHGEPSLVLGDNLSRATLTPRGGHVRIESRRAPGQPWLSPYSLPPWLPRDHPDIPPMLQILRGDFFCFPFGETAQVPYPHGETANRAWTVESVQPNSARLRMDLESMGGSVIKSVAYSPSARALWQQHVITGVEGQFNYGHHPIMQVPPGSLAEFSTGPWHFGQVHPVGLAVAADGDTAGLQPGARFQKLSAVPAPGGTNVRLDRYPGHAATEDLVMLSTSSRRLAWNAFSLPDFLWISLRSAADFPSTLLWLSNGGRPRPPWNGAHTGRIGIEDVCSYFHEGPARSRQDLLARERIPTSRQFMPDRPVVLRHLQIAIPVEAPFGQVADITFSPGNDRLLIEGRDGKSIQWPCPFSFVEVTSGQSAAPTATGGSGRNHR